MKFLMLKEMVTIFMNVMTYVLHSHGFHTPVDYMESCETLFIFTPQNSHKNYFLSKTYK